MPEFIQRSFTGGEIAPALRSRADLTKYATGLALCENMIIRSQGGAYSRPGLRFIGEARTNQVDAARLIPFVFNADQSYILVFQETSIRFIRDGAFITQGAFTYEVSTNFTADELYDIVFTQDADVMTLVHPNHPVQTLSRLADDNWALVEQSFSPTVTPPEWAISTVNITNITNDNPAFVTTDSAHELVDGTIFKITGVSGMPEANDKEYKASVASATGVELLDINGVAVDSTSWGTYTSGGTISQDEIVAVGGGAGTFEKTYKYVITSVDENGIESVASDPREITTDSLSETAGVRLSWNAVPGADYYRVYKDPSINTGTYGWIGDTENTRFEDYNTAPITSDAPPQDRDPFDSANNYPSTVGYYQQRQVFANTFNQPQTVFTTQSGVYNSFRTSVPARADDAIEFTIKARQVNEVRHIVALDSLLLLTSGAEWRVTEGQDQVLTPSTVGVRVQSYNGASKTQPAVINDSVVFVQEKGARIRDLKYEFSADRFSGNDLSIMAEHLFEGHNIIQMAYSAEPYGILWAIRDDGVLLGMTYQREHQVWAWHQHITDGEFESVAVIPEDGRDAVYVSVRRVIDGSEKQFIERMESRLADDVENAFCVDSGLSYDGSPATEISGLDHLEGKEVVVNADGNEVTGLTVTSGAITLPNAASKVHVGLPYTPTLELLDIDVNSPAETLKHQNLSVSRVVIEVEDSKGGWVGAKNDDASAADMVEIPPRFDWYGYGAVPLRSYKQEVIVQPQWSKGGGLRIEQRSPFPLAILSVIPYVDVG